MAEGRARQKREGYLDDASATGRTPAVSGYSRQGSRVCLWTASVHWMAFDSLRWDVLIWLKLFCYCANSLTRGNNYRLFKQRCHYDLRKFSFTNRIVNIWNSLPNTVVEVDTVAKFKLRLDKFWMYQDIKYDFTAELTGTGDRSECDSGNYY